MDGDALALVLEELVRATGRHGPFLIGTATCYLCGHTEQLIAPVSTDVKIGLQKFRCPRCEQKTLKFLSMNGDPDD